MLVWVSILMLAIVGFVALAIDGARAVSARHHLQTAADAAALAAALNLVDDTGSDYAGTRRIAHDIAAAHSVAGAALTLAANDANDAGGDVVIGRWDEDERSFTPDTGSPNAVQVTVRRTAASGNGELPFVFGGLFGLTGGDFIASAVALLEIDTPYIIVLDESAQAAMALGGSAKLIVDDGSVHVNSSASCAAEIKGSSGLDTPEITVVGDVCGADDISGDIDTDGEVKPDPFGHLLPDSAAWDAFRDGLPKPKGAGGKINGGGVHSPGHYPQGLRMTGGNASLQPGSYLFGGNGVRMSGGSLQGDGVTIFLDAGAACDIGGNASVFLSPPGAGTYAGMTLFSHPANTADDTVSLGGGGDVDIKGVVYVPEGGLAMSGNAGSKQIGGLVVNMLDFTGTADYHITGEDIPPTDDPTSRLVD